MGGAVMTDADFAYYVTAYLGRYLPGQRNPGPNTIASYRDASGPPVDYFGDHGKEPESMSTPDPGGHAVRGSPGGLRRAEIPTARSTSAFARQRRS